MIILFAKRTFYRLLSFSIYTQPQVPLVLQFVYFPNLCNLFWILVRFCHPNNSNKGKSFKLKSTNKTSLRSPHQHTNTGKKWSIYHSTIIRIRCRRRPFGKSSRRRPACQWVRDCYTFVWFFYSILFQQKTKTQGERKSKRKRQRATHSKIRNKSSGGITKKNLKCARNTRIKEEQVSKPPQREKTSASDLFSCLWASRKARRKWVSREKEKNRRNPS